MIDYFAVLFRTKVKAKRAQCYNELLTDSLELASGDATTEASCDSEKKMRG